METIKALLSNINKKDAIILGVLGVLILGVVIALIVFLATHWKWIVGIGVVVAVIAIAIFAIIKYLQYKKANPTA
ncbi:MAG TPA: hypothetical protein P5136_02800 [Methanofastidiosum sp.]|nr:hypothetical protein [Methanofastidiosum sp.]